MEVKGTGHNTDSPSESAEHDLRDVAVRRCPGQAGDRLFIAVLAAVGGSYILLIAAMLIADFSFTSPDHILQAVRSPEIQFSFWLSMVTCTLATLFSLIVGVPLGYLLARSRFIGRSFVNAVVDIPIALPPLVIGLSLLILFQTQPGKWLEQMFSMIAPRAVASFILPALFAVVFLWAVMRLVRQGTSLTHHIMWGLLAAASAAGLFHAAQHHASILAYLEIQLGRGITYAVPSIVLAQFTVACAFAARTMRAVFEQISPRTEDVALTLGCSRARAFWHVTLPEARRGMLTAGTISWARAMGEFGPILIFSGATRLRTEVLPTSVFLELSVGNIEAAVAVSLIMIAAAVSVLLIARVFGAGEGMTKAGAWAG